MSTEGVFIDPSEYRRNNFEFGGDRLSALVEATAKGIVSLLQTDVSEAEMRKLIDRQIEDACKALGHATISPLKAVEGDWFQVFRAPPNPADLANKLKEQFARHLKAASCIELSVSEVNPAVVFDAYFNALPPFDSAKKKRNFRMHFLSKGSFYGPKAIIQLFTWSGPILTSDEFVKYGHNCAILRRRRSASIT